MVDERLAKAVAVLPNRSSPESPHPRHPSPVPVRLPRCRPSISVRRQSLPFEPLATVQRPGCPLSTSEPPLVFQQMVQTLEQVRLLPLRF